jgi:hypothetical protein
MAGNSFNGLRAHYVLEERVAGLQRVSVQTVYNTRFNNGLSFTGGGSVQLQQTHYYKKINDLLGAEYSVDWNQFAERDFPDNPVAIQNDLEHRNRIIRVGDIYGYDYLVNTNKMSTWAR